MSPDAGLPSGTPRIAFAHDRLTRRQTLIHRACHDRRHFEILEGFPADVEASARCAACGQPLWLLKNARPVFFKDQYGNRRLAYAVCFKSAEVKAAPLWQGSSFGGEFL